MSRTIEQIPKEERIEISDRVIRTPELTITVEDGWALQQYHWEHNRSRYLDGPNAIAVAALVMSLWILANPIPPEMSWLIAVFFGVAIGAVWAIGRWAFNRWLADPPNPTYPTRGLTYFPGGEFGLTIFQSNDEQEIRTLRQKLEATLLPKPRNGE